MAGVEGTVNAPTPEAGGSSLWGADKAKVCQAWHDKASRVLVVGGGPAGVHFASLLRQAGYTKVAIVESAPRLGGKCLSNTEGSHPQEMGFATNIISEGPNPLEDLIQGYGLKDQEAFITERVIGDKVRSAVKMNKAEGDDGDGNEEEDLDNSKSSGGSDGNNAPPGLAQLSQPSRRGRDEFRRSVSDLSSQIRTASFSTLPPFRRMLTRRISNIKDQVASFLGKEPLVDSARRYARLHRRLLGTYAYGMPPKPKGDSLQQLNMTFVQFLKKNDLLSLVPVFLLCPIIYSYHFLSEIPAFYGLWWYNPVRTTALIDFNNSSLKVPQYTVLRCGWQSLWEKIAQDNGIEVVANTMVQSIHRQGDGTPGHAILHTEGQDTTTTREFDLLVVANNLRNSIQMIEDATEEERELGAHLQEFTICSTSFESDPKASERPIELFPFPKRSNAFGQVFAQLNMRLIFDPEGGPSKVAKDRRVVYQFLDRAPRVEDMGMLKRRLKIHFDDQAITKPSNVKQCPWKFFPHYSAKDLTTNEMPWKLLDMQGQNKTVYIGSSAAIDSINEVLLYNQQVFDLLGLTA